MKILNVTQCAIRRRLLIETKNLLILLYLIQTITRNGYTLQPLEINGLQRINKNYTRYSIRLIISHAAPATLN